MEGVDLLQAKNCGVGNFVFSLVILQVVKDFPGAKNDALGAFCDIGVGQYFLECATGEVGYGTGGTGIPEEAFRSHHNQGFDDFAKGLPTDEVKIVRRCCGICDGHIVLRTKLKESL